MTDLNEMGMTVPTDCPEPTGYKVLILPYTGMEKSAGGIIFADVTKEEQAFSSLVGYVVKLGKDAFTGEKFANGPWFREGDWVMIGRYAGNRFKVNGVEMRVLNDDEIICTVPNPKAITRA